MNRIISKIKEYKMNHSFGETVSWILVCTKFKMLRLKKRNKNFNNIKLNNNEEASVIYKGKNKIFIFGNIPYYDIGGGQRSSQLAKTFSKIGYPVYYIYGYKSGEATKINIDIPLAMHNYIEKVKVDYIDSILSKEDVCIFEAPSKKYDDFINLAISKKCKIVYENIDNWETSLGKNVADNNILKKLLKNSVLLIGTAKPLVEQLKKYCKQLEIEKNIVYLPNAVDDELFFPLIKYDRPIDMKLGKKNLLYYGSLWGEWFDWDILFKIAKKHPDYIINLIGDYNQIIDIVNRSPQNINYLGLKKQIELPAYLKYSDYAILPFKKGLIGDYVSPLKIFEYISMEKVVLATSLPDIKGYPNTYYGDTFEEWEEYLKEDIKTDCEKAQSFTEKNSWLNRTNTMLEKIKVIDKTKCESKFYGKMSIIVLNYNNKNIIDRCVESLIRNNGRYNYEIIVVDNGSKDGSYEQLKRKFDNKVKLLKNSKNGCSSGRNLGVKNSKGEYILFLDSDQWAMHDYWLEPYFEILSKNIKVGLIGWAAGWFNKYGKAYHVVDSFPNRSMPQNCLARCDIGYLGSGGMIITKKLFDKIGGFDINYDPTCYEDTDISLKVRNEGYEIYYCPYLGVMHLPHQTTKSGSKEHTKLINDKAEYFNNKWTKINPKLLRYTK